MRQDGIGIMLAPGRNSTQVKLVGIRTLAHKLFHFLSRVNRHDEKLTVVSAKLVR